MVCKTMYSSSILLGTSDSEERAIRKRDSRVALFSCYGVPLMRGPGWGGEIKKMSVGTSRADPHTNHIINNTKTNNQ